MTQIRVPRLWSIFSCFQYFEKKIIHCDTNSCTLLSREKVTKNKVYRTLCFYVTFGDLLEKKWHFGYTDFVGAQSCV